MEVNSPGSTTDRAGAGYVHGTDHPVAAPRSHKHALDGPLLLQVPPMTQVKVFFRKLDLQRSERRIKSLAARSSV